MSTVVPSQPGRAVNQPAGPGFQQRLGLFDATMLVAGSMIGSGIFIVSADIARDVGSPGWLLLVWVVTGVITVIGALSYAELAAMMPHAGGQYVYLREAYNPLCGFLYGWTLFLVIQTGTIAAVAVSFGKFLGVLVPPLGTDHALFPEGLRVASVTVPLPISAGQLVAVIVVVFLTLLNCLGVEQGKWVQNVFTVCKILALLLLIGLGLAVGASTGVIQTNIADPWSGATQTEKFRAVEQLVPLGGLVVILMVAGGTMTNSLFAADAWNNVTFTAGEVRNPRRSLPLSLVMGVGLVIVLYLLANVSYLAVLPLHGDPQAVALEAQQRGTAGPLEFGIDHARDDRVGTAVMEVVWPRFGAPLMAVGIMISLFGCANGLILTGARLYYAMARDGLFFRFAGRLNRQGVPAAGLLLQGLWACLLIFSGTYSRLLEYVIFAALLFYVLTAGGLFILRMKRPNAERPYRAFGYPVIPALYVFLCAVIMLDLLVVKPLYTWPGLLIVLTGIPVFFPWRARTARARVPGRACS
jgi:APA family basic amino acid/polyamine antiporter